MNYLPYGLWNLVIERDENINALMEGKFDLNEYEIRMSQYWDHVMDILHQRPEEAKISLQNQFPLERYLNRDYEDNIEDLICPPPQIIKKIIECNPSAVNAIDDQGDTILHRFCLYSSCSLLAFDIIQILCEAYPQATQTPNKNGNIPLHNYAWSNDHRNDFFILPFLIYHTPHHFLLRQNRHGETPLDCLCLRMGLIHQSSSNPKDFVLSSMVLDRHFPVMQEQIKDTWMYIIKLVSLSSTTILNCRYGMNDACENPYEHSLMELHSSIFFQCPRYFLQIVLEFFPHQLTMRDPFFDMSTPLGIVVSSRNNHVDITNTKRSYQLRKRFLLKCMLEKCPQVTRLRCTNDMVLPLHLSLYTGNVLYYQDGIDVLIQSDPSTVVIRDPKYHFYPFLLAACSKPQIKEVGFDENEEIEVQHLETVYSLIREVPWLIGLGNAKEKDRT